MAQTLDGEEWLQGSGLHLEAAGGLREGLREKGIFLRRILILVKDIVAPVALVVAGASLTI